MPGAIKIQKFLGTTPKSASELLPDTAAQVARNCKLYSGDLIPRPEPVIVGNAGQTGTLRTLYALRDPDTSDLVWLSWAGDVDIVTPAAGVDEQRFYYTGDGVPKVSMYELAVVGSPPYPAQFYDLGLPLPSQQPASQATPFSTVTSSSFARDTGNNVTLVLGSSIGLKSGAIVTISGFTNRAGTYSRSGTTITVTITAHGLSTGAEIYLVFTSGSATTNRYTITVTGTDTFTCSDTVSGSTSGNVEWDISDLNTTAEITVINSTTISYFSPGPSVTTTSSTAGKVDLGGNVQARSYVYTWYTPWAEESIGSEPSDALFIKEGQVVTVSNLPSAPPAGDNFIRGLRLYRTLAGTTDADYFRLSTLWFPTSLVTVSRTSNVSRVTLAYPHMLSLDERFKISGCSDASFDITGGVVTEIIDTKTFEYAQAAGNVASIAATGTLFHDVAERITDSARYWGDGSYNFTDDFNYRSLLNTLESSSYEAPPEDLVGLTVLQNNILAGFVGNTLYMSEPDLFHAWPRDYARSFDSNIVGLAPIGGSLLVLTEGYPYVVSGSHPAIMTQVRLSARYPCVSRRSIVQTSIGVVYASHDGLVSYSPATAAQLLTRVVHSSDTWNTDFDPSTLVAVLHKDAYFGSHASGSFVYELNDPADRPTFVDSDFVFSAAWLDTTTNNLYAISGNMGDIYLWDDLTQPNSDIQWKSKTLMSTNLLNIGAGRVLADYTGLPGSSIWGVETATWGSLTALWNAADPVVFKLYVNKSLLATLTLSDNAIFRLPAGYKADTFEVELQSPVRVRAVHLGETPTSLKEV